MEQRRDRLRWRPWWLLPIGCFLLWHAASGPDAFDVGELAAAAWDLGGSHAPGQPLHALLAHALGLVPAGPLWLRFALLSVGATMAATWWTVQLCDRLLSGFDGPGRDWLPHISGALVLLAPPVLRQAMRIEVYAPALACTVAAAAEIVHFAQREHASLRRAALWGALAAALHPPHGATIVALGSAAVLLSARGPRLRATVQSAFLFAAAAGVIYCYLPLRGVAGAPMWGTPTTWSGLWAYVSGAAYQHNLGGTGPSLGNALDVCRYILVASAAIPVVGLALGAGRTRAWILGAMLSAAALPGALLQPLAIANPDNVAYLAPCIALLCAAGIAALAKILPTGRAAAGTACVLVVAMGLRATSDEAMASWHADEPALETLLDELTDWPPPRALVIVEHDFEAASWLAARSMQGARPDVALFVAGLSTSSWHWRTLRSHPLFDGHPVRGRGADRHGQYTAGAVSVAAGRVAVLSESGVGLASGSTPFGPYLTASTGAAPDLLRTAHAFDRVASDTAHSRPPNATPAAAILRNAMTSHALRLAHTGQFASALRVCARALWWLPAGDKQRLSAAAAGVGTPRALAQTVLEPGVFLLSASDAERRCTTILFEVAPAAAVEMLEASHDARAVAQLAWLHLRAGQINEARAARDALRQLAPDLEPEARALDSALRGQAR